MLKYLKNKPIISVLAIAALAVTVLEILLIINQSGKLPPTSQESTPAQTMSQASTTQNSSSDNFTSQSDTTASSPSAIESTAKSKSTVLTTAPVKTSKKPSTKATTRTTTKRKPTTTTASSPKSTFANFQADVIVLVNEERTSHGLNALSGNTQLTNVATIKSQDMADLGYFDHTSPTYGSPFDMMKQFGISYKAAGENIAMGQTTPKQVMKGWMNSEGHRANILNASFTQIGIGIAKDASNRIYWTQMFIG